MSVLVTGCGPNKIIYNLPSPTGQYHVEICECRHNGSLIGERKTQISVLEAGVSEECQSAMNALVQFDGNAPENELQLEWISDTELRAWHPRFNPQYGPASQSYQANAPVKVIFAEKE